MATDPVDITVLTVFYNRADVVEASMRSLVDQQYRGYRVIAVDDGSTDDTYERLAAFRSDHIEVRRQPNRGFTPTMVALANEVETDFIAVHGSGDESLPTRLGAQRDCLANNANVVAVGCGIENVDLVSGRRWPVIPSKALRPGPMVAGFGISHGEVMFRRDIYVRAGGYRSLFPTGQATDLFRRMSRYGDFAYLPDILYRRYLLGDGVGYDIAKLAERGLRDALSRAAHRRSVERRDLLPNAALRDEIDRFGILFPYFLPPDREVAIDLARSAIKFWAVGDHVRASLLARRSLRERLTMQGLASAGAIALGRGPLRRPVQYAVEKWSTGAEEYDLATLRQASERRRKS